MITRTTCKGNKLIFEPVTTDDARCSICGNGMKRAVQVGAPWANASYLFCRPCVRRAARAADFKPVAHVTPTRIEIGTLADREGAANE